MSAQALADRTAELGHPMQRSVLANMENGRRATLGVAQLLVLARALAVPPMLLVFPVGHDQTAEVTPGMTVSTEDALSWTSGTKPLPHTETGGDDHDGWSDAVRVLTLYRREDELIAQWRRRCARATEYHVLATGLAEKATPKSYIDDELDQANTIKALINETRATIRAAGFLTRPLPDELANIE